MYKSALLVALCASLFANTRLAAQDTASKVAEQIEKLQSGTNAVKVQAAMTLADFGPDAAPAVPALVTALQTKDENLRLNAAIALGKIGTQAVEPVAKVLTSENASDRYYAIWTLGWIGPPAKATAPQVIQALADKDDSVRRKAAYTLGRISSDAKSAMPPLIKAFGDANNDVRQAAAEALASFGTTAVPSLIEALKEESPSIRAEAARALGKIGADAKDAIPNLKTVFLANDKASNEAAEALAKIGKSSIPAVSEGLKSDIVSVRALSVRTLGKIGADAVPVLVDALADKNVDVRQNAATALAPLRITDKLVVLALAHAVHDSDQRVRQQCLQALQMLGTGAKPAAPKLIAALKDSDGQNKMQILFVLQNLGEDSEHILPAAADLLKDPNVQVRQSAVNLLGNQSKEALPHLITALKDADINVRFAAVNAIQRIPGDIKEALPVLVAMSKEGQNDFRRRSVVMALGRVGEPAVPHLIDLLKDGDGFVRMTSVTALQGIGAPASKSVPIISDMLFQETNLATRRACVSAVAAIEPEKLTDLFARVRKHNDEKMRAIAYQSLSTRFVKKGPSNNLPAKLAVPLFIEGAKDASANVRLAVVQGLANYGPDAKDAVPVLTKMMEDPDARVRTQAQAALTQIKGK